MAVEILPYEFVDAERLRFGRFPVLDTILYRWARRIEQTLFERAGIEVYTGASVFEEMRFATFFATLRRSRPIFFVELTPLAGTGLFVTDNRFAASCLRDAGDGGSARLSVGNQRRLQGVVQAMMADFDAAWRDVHGIRTRLRRLTTYPFRARVLQPYEPCLVAQLHLAGRGISTRLTWCLPRLTLEPIAETLRKRRVLPSLTPERRGAGSLSADKVLAGLRVSLPVRLGQVDPKELAASLKQGAVLPIRNDAGGQAALEINGQPQVAGTLGSAGGRYAFRLDRAHPKPRASVKQATAEFRPIQWPSAPAP